VGGEENKRWILASPDEEELAEIIANVVNGQAKITYAELLSLAPEIENEAESLASLLEHLDQLGISVVVGDEEGEDEETQKSQESLLRDLASVPVEDLLDVYLAEVSQEQLLTHEEEIALAKQIEMGHLAQEALEETDYNAKEYRRLQALAEAGQAAREHLGSANTRLVISIAKRYRGYGIPFTDLIQDGNVGLMRAVDNYDHRTGNRFSTYATWWIRQAVTRSLSNHGRVIRIPVHTGDRIRKMSQVSQRLEMEYGRRPTPEDIAKAMDESPAKIRQMMRWASQTISLEQPAGEDGDAELSDFIQDDKVEQPEDLTDIHLLNEMLGGLMGNLTVREAQILRLRFGLHGANSHTLGQIGEKFGLSRERIRQIEREALAKLRLVAPNHHLEQFL
jgi:RNA polymerase primary sigma factor